jgi:hypothetical protein
MSPKNDQRPQIKKVYYNGQNPRKILSFAPWHHKWAKEPKIRNVYNNGLKSPKWTKAPIQKRVLQRAKLSA